MIAAASLQPAAEEVVQILLVGVGEEQYGVDATQVLRIDRAESGAFAHPALGTLREGRRSLVFQTENGEAQLKVDAILGVDAVPISRLRRMPPAATRSPLAVGLYLSDERPIVLIDLPLTL
jgi:chemotaxis signal transduction protein